jgi:hypothetical protein
VLAQKLTVCPNQLLHMLQVIATAITLAPSLGIVLSIILGSTMHLLPSLFTQ